MAPVTVLDMIKRALPDGTGNRPKRWAKPPVWPPDLFAAMAVIADRSRLYCDRAFLSHWAPTEFALGENWIKHVYQTGEEWADKLLPPRAVTSMWKELIDTHGSAKVDTRSGDRAWEKIVFCLLSIADETCAGMGFPPSKFFSKLYLDDYLGW